MSHEVTSIFFLGVTGYIGGPVFKRLQVLYPNGKFSTVVRAEKHVAILQAAGMQRVILDSHGDLAILREASSAADVVVNAADNDKSEIMAALLLGMKDRFLSTNQRPVLIHTSGTGVICDRSLGNFDPKVAAEAYDDANEGVIKSISPDAIHRNVDDLVFAANAEGYIDGWIVSPSLAYGKSKGLLPRVSHQIPIIVKLALEAHQAVYINDGTAVWDNVHVEDLADLYVLILAKALKAETRTTKSSPYSKFYLVTSGKHTWKEMTEAVAQALYKHGAIPTATARSISFEDAMKLHPTAFAVMTNCFAIATRAAELGWKPKYRDWKAEIDGDVQRVLETL